MTLTSLDTAAIDLERCLGASLHLTGNIATALYDGIVTYNLAEREADITSDTIALEVGIDTLDTGNTISGGQIAKLTDDLQFICWGDTTGTDTIYGIGKSSTQNSSTASFTKNSGGASLNSAKTTSSKALVLYTESSVGNYNLLARVADVSDSTVTFNSSATLISGYSNLANTSGAAYLSDNNICAAVRLLESGGDDGLYLVLITVSGTTPSWTYDTVLVSGSGGYNSSAVVVNIGADEVIVFYDTGASTNQRAVKVSRSGSTLSVGTPVTLFADTNHNIVSADFVTSGTCVIAYTDTNDSPTSSNLQTVDVSGNPSLNGDELEIIATTGSSIQSVAAVSSTRLFTTYNTATQHHCALISSMAAASSGWQHSAGGIPGGII